MSKRLKAMILYNGQLYTKEEYRRIREEENA